MGKIRPDDEDEDKETLINNYLDFRESLTPEQKKNYFALPVGYNKVDNLMKLFFQSHVLECAIFECPMFKYPVFEYHILEYQCHA